MPPCTSGLVANGEWIPRRICPSLVETGLDAHCCDAASGRMHGVRVALVVPTLARAALTKHNGEILPFGRRRMLKHGHGVDKVE